MNGKKIDAIQFIQDKENLSKHEAIKKAKSLIGAITQQTAPKPITQTENLTEIPALSLAEVFQKLRQSFYSSSKARAYA